MPAGFRRTVATRRAPARKTTRLTAFVDDAATDSCVVRPTHVRPAGSSHVTVGASTTVSRTESNVELGKMFLPTVLTFFDSWKSEPKKVADVFPRGSAGALGGSANATSPVTGS